MIEPPQPRLVVGGTKQDPAMDIRLVPLAYIRQPEYWAIQVVGSVTETGGQPPGQGSVPYTAQLDIIGMTGTTGVEVVGASRRLRMRLVPQDATQFVGSVEHDRYRPISPASVAGQSLRLTTVSIVDDTRPESGELDLTGHDGSVLRVTGHYQDGWIYSVTLVATEQGGT
ncbi:MAG TPA: hypothetical protein VJT31_14490 [Rugosimonospora sp.]|nr:hypothetical protein [Rugosimonospora sp.]